MTGERSERRQWWTAVADWRNWRLPVKLAAVLAVPVMVAVGAGVVQIRGYVKAADDYAAMQRLVTLRAGLDPLIIGVQAERAFSAQRAEGAGVDVNRFRNLVRATDTAAAGVRNLMERTQLGEVAGARFRDVTVQLDGLPQLRDRVISGSVDLAGGIGGYSVVLRALLDFDQAMIGDFGDSSLSGTATALHNVTMAAEQMSWQHATVLAGISRGTLLDIEKTMLEQSWTRQQDKLADFGAVATPRQQADYRATVAGQDVDVRNSLLQQVRSDPASVAGRVSVDDWNDGAVGASRQIGIVLRNLEDQLAQAATRLQDQTSDRAGAASVILLASLFAAAAVGFVVGNYLLRSLRALRVAALDVAEHRLPTLVAQLREDAAPDVTVEPVPVHTHEELGQVARAFDAVHRQAVSSAAEQADLRTAMRSAFVNLSRRSQSLVERQLKLMEELERQEENPEQLANLFKLDNLATRMRRNNENLMVLSGSDTARRFTRPVPLGDVLRAAASEIEQYQRIVVQATPQVEVVGYAAGDLVRLVAELLDNATNFSPPRTQVIAGGRSRPGGGVFIDVLDAGVGMSEEDLAEANHKIARAAGDESGELPVSRQLGLYVVGRLAGRHGMQVMLREQGEGVRAVVALPPELVRAVTAPEPRHVAAAEEGWTPFAGAGETPLPTRTPAPVPAASSNGKALPTRTPVAVAAANGTPGAPTAPPAVRTAGVSPTTPASGTPLPTRTPGAVPAASSTTPPGGTPLPTRTPGPVPAASPTTPPKTPPGGTAMPPRTPAGGTPPPPRGVPGTPPGGTPLPTRTPNAAPPPPAASTPPHGTPRRGSTWFTGTPVPPGPAEPSRQRTTDAPAPAEVPAPENSTSLPKRRPRTNLVADRPGTAEPAAPVRRDPDATRGFLANYQTGIRQGVKDSGENRTGREST